MYLRIKNRLDAAALHRELVKDENIPNTVADRVLEVIQQLDDHYGEQRGCHAYGGYLLYFHNQQSYQENISDILSFYHIERDIFEYSDIIIRSEGMEWYETLYLLSSDDSLVLVYPQEVSDV